MKTLSKGYWLLIAAILIACAFYFFAPGRDPEGGGRALNDMVSQGDGRSVPKAAPVFELSIDDPQLRIFMKQFYSALHSDDFAAVSASFSEDATVFENGVREPSLAIYLETHLKPEMAVMKSAKRQILEQEAVLLNDHAHVTTSAVLSFSVEGKQLNFHSTETLVLKQSTGRWQLQHAHWSSRPVQN